MIQRTIVVPGIEKLGELELETELKRLEREGSPKRRGKGSWRLRCQDLGVWLDMIKLREEIEAIYEEMRKTKA